MVTRLQIYRRLRNLEDGASNAPSISLQRRKGLKDVNELVDCGPRPFLRVMNSRKAPLLFETLFWGAKENVVHLDTLNLSPNHDHERLQIAKLLHGQQNHQSIT